MKMENKSGRKILKWILLILFVILIIVITLITRKMIIISNLQNKISQYKESSNYYAKILAYFEESKEITECYVKEDSYLSTIIHNNTGKVVEYCDGKIVNTYIDTIDGEKILEVNGVPDKILVADYLANIDKFKSIFISIKSEKYNEQDCYYIEFSQNTDKIGVYINKETGLPMKACNGMSTNSNGEKFDNFIEYQYEFDVVTNEDIKEPDITGYQMVDNL